MIRATNTIKHLDVKTRLFEEREGREGGTWAGWGGAPKEKPRSLQGGVGELYQALVCAGTLIWRFCAFMHACVHESILQATPVCLRRCPRSSVWEHQCNLR